MVALEGQHRGLETKALSKVVPFSVRDLRLGMCLRVFGFMSRTARSSVTIKTMLGCLGGLSLSSSGAFPWAAGKQAQSVKQVASSKRRVGKGSARLRPTRTPRARPVLILSGIAKLPLWFGILEGDTHRGARQASHLRSWSCVGNAGSLSLPRPERHTVGGPYIDSQGLVRTSWNPVEAKFAELPSTRL